MKITINDIPYDIEIKYSTGLWEDDWDLTTTIGKNKIASGSGSRFEIALEELIKDIKELI